MRRLAIAVIGATLVVGAQPVFADAPAGNPLSAVAPKPDRDPPIVCIMVSATSVPDCLDLTQMAGHQR